MSDELLSVIDSFVAKAQKLGVDEVELYAHKQKQKTVKKVLVKKRMRFSVISVKL